jgi:hypothetical protein
MHAYDIKGGTKLFFVFFALFPTISLAGCPPSAIRFPAMENKQARFKTGPGL